MKWLFMNETLNRAASHGKKGNQIMDAGNIQEKRHILYHFPSYLLREVMALLLLVPAYGF